jgi:hypothetical protein
MDSNTPTLSLRRSRFAGVLACVFVLVTATLGQALDSCEFSMFRVHQQVTTEHSSGVAPAYCLICAAAHSAPLLMPPAVFAPVVERAGSASIGHDSLRSSLRIFALYVRPPPVL